MEIRKTERCRRAIFEKCLIENEGIKKPRLFLSGALINKKRMIIV
jgi:hypothetical protein